MNMKFVEIYDGIRRIGRKATLSYKGLFAVMDWHHYLMVNLAGPVTQMLCFTLIAYYVYGVDDVSNWLVGNALVMTYFNAVFGIGVQLTAEKNTGTLRLLVASPSSRIGIFMPRAILHIFDGLLSVLIGFIIGFLILGFRLDVSQWPAFFLVLIIASFSAMAFGLLISCFGLLTRDLNLILNVASMSMLGLTGANFPIDRLPEWLVPICNMMPLTRSITLCRGLLHGQSLSSQINLLYGELSVGICLLVLSFAIFGFMERIAIKDGTLELF